MKMAVDPKSNRGYVVIWVGVAGRAPGCRSKALVLTIPNWCGKRLGVARFRRYASRTADP